jgi:hypothetical protein
MFDLLSRLKEPAIFQGNLGKKNYFEGWYFKQVGSDGAKLAVIPGISLTKEDRHAFIQVFNGRSGKSHYFSFPIDEFKPEKSSFGLAIGKNRFNYNGIFLEIEDKISVQGSLKYSELSHYRYSWRERGVMGWFGYIPFMETYHGILSLDHRVDGLMTINGELHEFMDGRGYIEKDWGESFPSSWIWMQSNCFQTPKTSIMVSIAVIPWLGSSFIGHLAVILHEGKIFNLSTYQGGKVTSLNLNNNPLSLTIETKKNKLEIKVERGPTVDLKSPKKGKMIGRTIESLSSRIEISLVSKLNNKSIFKGTGLDAGLEIMDEKQELSQGLGLI